MIFTKNPESGAPKRKEKKKSPYLTFVDVKKHFPHLFTTDADKKVWFGTSNTAVDEWFKTRSQSLVDPSTLQKLVGRAFWLKHRKLVYQWHISPHLNGSAQSPVRLTELSQLISRVVDKLIKWELEKPERELRDTWKEDPSFRGMSFRPESQLGENETPKRETIIFSENSPEYITNDARGRISHLKWTAPNKAKGTEEQIRAKVFTAMRWKYSTEEVDDDMLRSCIIAAWDQLSGSGSHYVCSKKIEQAAWGGTKPINLLNKK